MRTIDINCDMGESTSLFPYSMENDLELMHYISSVNLACGFHAGDASTMHRLVESALELRVAVGAHPGFADRENFGRMERKLSPEMLYDILIYQFGALQAFLHIYGSKMHHVKVHGALYNMAAREELIAEVVCNAIRDFDESLVVYGLAGSELIKCAEQLGLRSASEAFADRTYQDDGSLTSRKEKGALIEEENTAINQALQMVKEGLVTSQTGKKINIKIETLCLHGDGKHALQFAKAIYGRLNENNIIIQQPS